MTIQQVLRREAEAIKRGNILLLREGLFWRAYEESAFILCKYVNPFKVTTRFVKCADSWVSLIGFPNDSLQKWTQGREQEFRTDTEIELRLMDEEQQSLTPIKSAT